MIDRKNWNETLFVKRDFTLLPPCRTNVTHFAWSAIISSLPPKRSFKHKKKTRMASSRDITAASINNVGDDFTEGTNGDDEKPSTRNRIACQTGHILNNLTSSMWYSYALLYFQEVAGLFPTTAGIMFFISQILTVVTLLVVRLGRDKRIWNSFSSYGIQKARHVVGSAIVLFAWPFTATPCLFCGDGSSSLELGMYYLIPVVLLSVGWPLTDVSYSKLMKEMRTESGKVPENSR